ncbi:unnamed protein product [Bursaphelenchus okinawaensis]|uniref:Uncharacterized protein n=1 Tax=Bursaphelenchus okinawaensis TaxID=465554 RepID=A0A811JWK2_9BILA|nr:unnamed protein product [Bursaphelenchus okinawaensis]CAG9086364.1 unnamed protein product [Bursaphelenchus okinawaensis]
MSVHKPDNIKPSSAPSFGNNLSPVTHLRSESPFCSPYYGMNTNIKPEKTNGILHRIDNKILAGQLKLCQVETVRCPSCRLQSQLVCPACVSSNFRTSKLKEAYRESFLKKAEIDRKMDVLLQLKMKLDSDLFAKQRNIKLMKEKIEVCKENIYRLKKKIAVAEMRRSKCEKNVRTLDLKQNSHSKRIGLQEQENAKLKAYLKVKRDEIFCYIRFYTSLFSHYIPIQRFTKENKKMVEATSSTTVTEPPQQWPPVKKFYFTVNGCVIEDNNEYERLLDDLLEGVSVIFLGKHSKHAYSGLLYTIRLVNVIAYFADLWLPYRYDLKDFALCTGWSQDLFYTDMFKLNVNVLSLAAAFGLKNEQIKINQPVHNLHTLVNSLLKNDLTGTDGLVSEKMKHQIFDAFSKFVWEERNDRLEVDNVEEDWVNVGFSM